MKHTIKYAIFLFLCLPLTACSLLNHKIFGKGVYDDFAIPPLPHSVSYYTDSNNCPVPPAKKGTGSQETTKCPLSSDEAITRVYEESIYACAVHMKNMYGNEAAWNISTGSLAALTSGWSAISSGAQASTLAAISAFTSGEKALVNETIYKQQVTTSIGIKIAEMRETKANAIRSKLGSKDYSIALAQLDLLDFNSSCSFYVGLQKALKEGSDTTPALKASQLETKKENLIGKLDMYIRANTLVRTNAALNNQDPVYKSMVDDLASINAQISNLTNPAQKPADKTPSFSLKPASSQLTADFTTPVIANGSVLVAYTVNLIAADPKFNAVLSFKGVDKDLVALAGQVQGKIDVNGATTTIVLTGLESKQQYRVEITAIYSPLAGTAFESQTATTL